MSLENLTKSSQNRRRFSELGLRNVDGKPLQDFRLPPIHLLDEFPPPRCQTHQSGSFVPRVVHELNMTVHSKKVHKGLDVLPGDGSGSGHLRNRLRAE